MAAMDAGKQIQLSVGDSRVDAKYHEMGPANGEPIVFVHTGGAAVSGWMCWHLTLPFFAEAGYRCIAPDYAGFGRSDKPTDLSWYTYDRHVELMATLLEELDVRDATAVVHDWGGPIGLRLAVEHPDRFSRLVIMDTGPFTGHQRMSETWLAAFRHEARGIAAK